MNTQVASLKGLTNLNVNLDGMKKTYVALMMEVIGRSLEAASQVDPVIQNEIKRLPEEFSFEMMALPDGPRFCMRKVNGCNFKYIGRKPDGPLDASMKFKHVALAFLVLSFQESTSRAYANDRLLVDGEVSDVMKLIRCLNRMEVMILPKLIAERAVKRYPNVNVLNKLTTGGKIYARFVRNVVTGITND